MRRLRFAVLIGAAACGPRGTSANGAHVPDDADLRSLAAGWTVDNHIITPRSYITDSDAAEWHGRTLAINATTSVGYTTPFQGACKDASYTKRKRMLTEVATDEDLAGDSRFIPSRFGLPATVTEFKFVCGDRGEDGKLTLTPILTIYQGGDRAMTCFSGVCYLLSRK